MRLSVNFGRWTTTKAAMTIAAALAIGGAVSSAVAIGPTIAPPIKWAGGWEVATPVSAGSAPVFTVPAGNSLLVSDLVVGNLSGSAVNIAVFGAGNAACDTSLKVKLVALPIPPLSTVNIPLQSGLGFASGQRVCVNAHGGSLNVNLRGFLFTPAPAG